MVVEVVVGSVVDCVMVIDDLVVGSVEIWSILVESGVVCSVVGFVIVIVVIVDGSVVD